MVAEVLSVTPHILEEIKRRGSGPAREEWRKENVDMLKHGLARVLAGEVDPLDLIAHVEDFTQDDMRRAEQIWA
ncbi:MAG TPA: hypothetical protein EYP20_00940 [Aigarchaeota archaeon]|nr:hypothetical protein [Aigarchaeota archaeon]